LKETKSFEQFTGRCKDHAEERADCAKAASAARLNSRRQAFVDFVLGQDVKEARPDCRESKSPAGPISITLSFQ
jgi:hypothetical protein